MAKATCVVTGKDYLQYWGGQGGSPVPPPSLWTGEERRRGDERRRRFDRRHLAQTGRRFIRRGGRRAGDQ